MWILISASKGQLISKCLFGVIVSTKIATKRIVRISALKFFPASCGLVEAFWDFLGT
jgi:hypothetical protein